MRCNCGAELDESKAVPVPGWKGKFWLKAIPCFACRTVTLQTPDRIDYTDALAWARKQFGFSA